MNGSEDLDTNNNDDDGVGLHIVSVRSSKMPNSIKSLTINCCEKKYFDRIYKVRAKHAEERGVRLSIKNPPQKV